MKSLIDKVVFKDEWESKFGIMYNHIVSYYNEDDKIETGFYSSKKKEQTYFVPGMEAEFTLEEKQSKSGSKFNVIKPVRQGQFSGFNKNLKREQSRYAGFAVSYCKDLIIADKLKIEQWEQSSKKIFNFMVELDKSIES